MKKAVMAFWAVVFSVNSFASDVCYSNFAQLKSMFGGVYESCLGGWYSIEKGVPFSPVKLDIAYGDLVSKIKKAGESVKGTGRTYDLDGDPEIIASAKRAAAVRKEVLRERLNSINQIPDDLVCQIGYIDALNKIYADALLGLNGYCRHDLSELARMCTDQSHMKTNPCHLEGAVFQNFRNVIKGEDPGFETGVVAENQRLDEKTALKKWKESGKSWVKLQPLTAENSGMASARSTPQPAVAENQSRNEQESSSSSGGGFWSALGTFVGALSGAAETYNNNTQAGSAQNNQYVAPAPQVRNNDLQRQQICNSCQIRKQHACNQVDLSAHPSPAMRMDCAHNCFNECK